MAPTISVTGTLRDAVNHWASEAPDRPALVAPGRLALTYGTLAGRIDAVGARLRALGVRPKDRVALLSPDGPEMALAAISIAAWAPLAPLNPAYRARELDFYLTDLAARVVVVATSSNTEVRSVAKGLGVAVLELSPELLGPAGGFTFDGDPVAPASQSGPTGPDDVALLLHTSGTTSRPKLVPLSQRNLLVSALNVATTLELAPADRCLNVMPLFHIHGLVAGLLASLCTGATVACTPGFLASRFAEWIHELAPTWYTAVPTMHQAVLETASREGRTRCAGLRFIRSSSASLAPGLMAALEEHFQAPVVEAYGMTEAAHQMSSNPLPPRIRVPGTVGMPAGPEVRILGAEGGFAAPGTVGEVAIRGDNVFVGYEGNAAANAEAFVDGWFRTGDLGVLDERGYLTIRGRLKEIINRGGEKISPREVDEVLLGHPAVAQAVAFALPHPGLGEEVAAACVLEPGAMVTEGELQDHVAARLAHFKVPRRIHFLERLPLGPTGKVQRIGMATALGLDQSATPSQESVAVARRSEGPAPPLTPLEDRVLGLMHRVLSSTQATADARFYDVGGESNLALMLIHSIHEELGVELPLHILDGDGATASGLARLIEMRRPAP